jgi:hypothetical protein
MNLAVLLLGFLSLVVTVTVAREAPILDPTPVYITAKSKKVNADPWVCLSSKKCQMHNTAEELKTSYEPFSSPWMQIDTTEAFLVTCKWKAPNFNGKTKYVRVSFFASTQNILVVLWATVNNEA